MGYIPRSLDSKVILLLSVLGAVGALVGVLCALNIPSLALEIYIGIVILGTGLFVFLKKGGSGLSWGKLAFLGLLASFNKGISGAGYIPLIAGGQRIAGREVRSAVGSTTMVVSLACLASFLGYLFLEKIDWRLVLPATAGATLASPLAALTVRRVNPERLRRMMGIIIAVLGALTIIRAFI